MPTTLRTSPERLAQVTDVDVYRHLANNEAFGTPETSEDDLPDQSCSTTIKFHKTAISHFMPRWRQAWDEIRKEGNPTKSPAINDLIKKIERHEVRGMGVATTARRPIKWDEYIMLLITARHFFPSQESNVHDTCHYVASVAFYQPNRQYYVPHHDNNSAVPLPPIVPATENVQV